MTKYRFNENDLREILSECEKEFDTLGIYRYPVNEIRFRSFSTKAGQCIQEVDAYGNVTIEIAICKKVAREDANFDRLDLKRLIMHELIHTVIDETETTINTPYGKQVRGTLSHGSRWNEIARLVQKTYPEYNFFNDKSYDDIFASDLPVKFVYKCEHCGNIEKFRKNIPSMSGRCLKCGRPVYLKKPEPNKGI